MLENEEPVANSPDEELPPHGEADAASGGMVSPIPGYTIPADPDESIYENHPPLSPIRPAVQDDVEPHEPLMPSFPEPGAGGGRTLTPREQMQRAEEALIQLREKMAEVAAEFAQGRLNQAQFEAIYGRYSEQRDITERLLARNPESQAWQHVIQPGHTTFLIEHFAARALSFAVYDQETFALISVIGSVRVERDQTRAVLARLKVVIDERGNPGPAQKLLKDGRCVLFVPGAATVAVVVFSLEPSLMQIERVQDLLDDFERANVRALRSRDYAAERLVYPQRALFEKSAF